MSFRIKRIHIFLALLGFVVCAIPFRTKIRSSAVSAIQILKGRRSVADRLREFGTTVHDRLAANFKEVGISYPAKRIILLGLKQERVLEVWISDGATGFGHLKTYPILAASGTIGPKLAEGDQQVPEGIYDIESLNPNSLYHLSLRVGYPNTFDRERARLDGRNDLGSDIMIHGKSVSIGCLAIGDQAVEDLFVLVAETGIENVRLVLSPIDFRSRDLPAALPNMPGWTPELYANIRNEMNNLKRRGDASNDAPATPSGNPEGHKQMKPQLDERKANDYLGKTVLIGVTFLDHEDRQTGQQQWYGVITEFSNAKGIVIALKNDTNYCALPPDLSALRPAKPGKYRLRSTGEFVTDPDFVTTWTRRAPEPKVRTQQ